MAKKCTVPSGETIVKGDAVCVTGFDTAKNRPTIKRATRGNLETSKTIFGVAKDDAVAGSVFVLVAGEVAENAVTGLGAGESRIIVTELINADETKQCKLTRIDDTKGGMIPPSKEVYVVGTCDEHGHLVIQPRHSSEETEFPQVFNVRAYGAVPDDPLAGSKNAAAFQAALDAMRANPSTVAKLVADGTFYLTKTLELTQTIIFEGLGRNDQESGGGARSRPGTMLVFPGNMTGIRILRRGSSRQPDQNLQDSAKW